MPTDTPETNNARRVTIDTDLPKYVVPASFAENLERQRDSLAGKFTRLDKPKYSGDPMLDELLKTTNPDFREWVESLPPTYWARYDLSAARIGWEAARKFYQEND